MTKNKDTQDSLGGRLGEFGNAIMQIADEKGIPREKIIEIVEAALAAAYKKDYGKRSQKIRAQFDEKTGGTKFFLVKEVVDENTRIILEEGEDELVERDKKDKDASDSEETKTQKHKNTENTKTLDKESKEVVEGVEKDSEGSAEDEGGKEKKESEEESIGDKEEKESPPSQELRRGEESEECLPSSELRHGEEEVRIPRYNSERDILLEEAKEIKKDAEVGDVLEMELETQEDYGRIAAQTAKQVIIQRVREAEREAMYTEYKEKEGEAISGIVQRIEGLNIFVDLGKSTGLLPMAEQIKRERYQIGQRIRVYVMKVELDTKGPGISLSRTHPELVRKLFELEVPEIFSGTVEIKSIAREAGSRTKIAVYSKEEGVDPIGSCVGQKGTRVQAIIDELGGEKIDIIEWSEDLEKFISAALSPAKVLSVEINEEFKSAKANVLEDQYSLAIGKKGQNVRLAARLCGYRIDVVANKQKDAEGEESTVEDMEGEHGEEQKHKNTENTKTRNKKSEKNIDGMEEDSKDSAEVKEKKKEKEKDPVKSKNKKDKKDKKEKKKAKEKKKVEKKEKKKSKKENKKKAKKNKEELDEKKK